MAADTPKTRTVRLHGVELVIEEGQNGLTGMNRWRLTNIGDFSDWAMSLPDVVDRLLDEAMDTQP